MDPEMTAPTAAAATATAMVETENRSSMMSPSASLERFPIARNRKPLYFSALSHFRTERGIPLF
jgi:hypothetical protein